MESYFRIEPGDSDPQRLLDPDEQTSEPWSGTVRGRCDKCAGSGQTNHECESCTADGARADCPSCGGKITYTDECPACEGTGEIDDTQREGISVFPELDGLYRYMIRRDAAFDGAQVVKLAGEPSEDEDFDADEGALLIRPSEVLDVEPVDRERVKALRAEMTAGS